MRGTLWKPVPGREGVQIPTNIEIDGKIGEENGEADGYTEESEEKEEDKYRFESDPSQDENIAPEIESESNETENKPQTQYRAMYVTKWMVEKYGPTKGCPGCRAIINGKPKQTHRTN